MRILNAIDVVKSGETIRPERATACLLVGKRKQLDSGLSERNLPS